MQKQQQRKDKPQIKGLLPYIKKLPLDCPYCGKEALFNQGYWRCGQCNAQVKTHPNSKTPVGTMANKSLREARKLASAAFGRLMGYWLDSGMDKNKARNQAKSDLSKLLNIPLAEFNIECFDAKLCMQLVKEMEGSNLRPTPTCPYCSKKSVYIQSKMIYRCDPCDAQVGIHKHNHQPLGSLANAELRMARKNAHAHFDPLWQRKMAKESISSTQARKKAYKWLAEQMGLTVDDCHIGIFDVEQCKKAVEICLPYRRGNNGE